MRESTIEKAVCRYAQVHGWLVHPKVAYYAGWPDRTFSDGIRVIFVEFKAPGGHVSKLQALTHQKLREAGYGVYVIDSIEAGKALFKESLAA